jgi:hypothetical protein
MQALSDTTAVVHAAVWRAGNMKIWPGGGEVGGGGGGRGAPPPPHDSRSGDRRYSRGVVSAIREKTGPGVIFFQVPMNGG